jgi:tetratricopeptide (TPR) repeat protein
MLAEGRGRELERIRRVVLLATPNTGSQLLLGWRRRLLRHNPQEKALRPFDEQLGDTRRTVMRDIVHATTVTERSCPIPFSVYAGESDGIVTPASARDAFPDAAALPGDHASIACPTSREHRTYTTVKRLLLDAVDRDSPSTPRWPRLPLPAPGGGSHAITTDQLVVGEIPREPPAFVTRETLAVLAETVAPGGVTVVCAVTGLRGAGKTQLAAAYARACASAGWTLVGWVNAEISDTLLAGLARIAEQIGVGDPAGSSLESAQRLREHLQARPDRSLLVFDNATDPDLLRPFLPSTGQCQVVITTTDQAFMEFGQSVEVAEFSRPESLEYLAARTGLADRFGAAAVAEELGDLPLGLAQAAATIHRQRLTYKQYLEQLRRVPVRGLLRRIPGTDYPRSTASALLLSIQATEAGDPAGLASRVQRIVAALSPDGVHRSLLGGLAADGEDEVSAALELCVGGSLLTWSVNSDAVIMHRLLGRVLRERDQADGQWAETVNMALRLLEPRLIPEDEAWARRDEGTHLAAQIEALWQADIDGSADSNDLCSRELRARNWAVRQLRAAADLNRAIDWGTRTAGDCERALGADHPDTLTSRNDLAEACRLAGQLQQAIALFERTLADRVRVLGADHPDTLISRRNLAQAYRSAGRVREAIVLYEQTLADRERILGADHPLTLASSNDLGYNYWSAGRAQEAIVRYEQTLADRERVLGADHPDTLTSRSNLAQAYTSVGRVQEAIALYERTLADRERVLGIDHPQTLVLRNDLAYAYRAAGRLQQAIELFERTLADRERLLGLDHPRTLNSRNNLGQAYRSAGRVIEAIELFEQTLADRERLLNSQNPQIFASRNDLAHAYLVGGRVDEAIEMFERTLADRERILGADHPRTLSSRNYLGEAYRAADRLIEAIEMFERTLADRERLLGLDHPRTLDTRNNLGQAYRSAGRLVEAIELFEQTLADRERILGADHADTLTSRNNLEHARIDASLRPR